MSFLESGIPRKVIISHESPDAHVGAKVGGAASVALNQSREMYQMGRRVELIGPRNGGEGKLDVPHQLFPMPEVTNNDELLDTFRRDEWMTFWEKTLRSRAEDGECDIYGHYYVTGGIISELNGVIRGKKIYMGHSWDRTVQRMDPTRKVTPTREKAETSIISNSDAIIVATEAERQMVAQDYQDVIPTGKNTILDKTHVVPLGLNEYEFSPQHINWSRNRWRRRLIPEDLEKSLNFYMVGRITPQKNQLMAVQAFVEALKIDDMDLSLSIYGGPLDNNSYYDRIQEFIKTQPEEIKRRINFHGVQDPDVAHSAGDVFLGNSTWETFFLAATEAMASGKPTIISNKPILREVVGEGSLFVDETNLQDTAEKIHVMAKSEELREHSSRYNFNRAWQNYTWSKSARRLDEVWQKLRA